MTAAATDRFWPKVDRRGDDECWPWTASADKTGYGYFWLGKGFDQLTIRAHIYAYQLVQGPVPAGLEVDHNCHNLDASCSGGNDCPHRRCVNPAHLRAVTRGVNIEARHRGVSSCGHAIVDRGYDRRCFTCKNEKLQERRRLYGRSDTRRVAS